MTAEEIVRRALRLLDVVLPPGTPTTSTLTARDVITYAMRECGILEAGETPAADDADDALNYLQNLVDAWADEGVSLGLGVLALETTFAAPTRLMEAIQAALSARLAAAFGKEGAPPWQAINSAMLRRAKAHYRAQLAYDALNTMLGEWETMGLRLGDVVDDTLTAASEVPVPPTHLNAIIYNLAVRVAPEMPVEAPAPVAAMAARAFSALRSQYVVVPKLVADPALYLQSGLSNNSGAPLSGGDGDALYSDSGPLYP